MSHLNKRVFIKTYGCQMNVYDSERMKDILSAIGYQETKKEENADLIILNTCHIREKATEKVYSEIGRIKSLQKHLENNSKSRLSDKTGANLEQSNIKTSPQKSKQIIAIVGCTAQAEGIEIKKRAPIVDLVIGSQSYQHLPELIKKIEKGEKIAEKIEFNTTEKFKSLNQPRRIKTYTAFVTIQEGCDKFCTFCVVPYTRGAEVSRSVDDITNEVRMLVQKGVKEITLLGQNVNAYHASIPYTPKNQSGVSTNTNQRQPTHQSNINWGLGDLLKHLAKINGLERLRFTTSHPKDMNDDLFNAFQNEPKLMPYLHLPVQSGSDKILKAMNRQHCFSDYVDIIRRLRKIRPDIALSGDFIVGFPGETEEDFQETLKAVETIGYAQAFSFKYSTRPGTPGAMKKDQIPESVKSVRLSKLQDLLRAQQSEFNQSQLGKTLPVLFEKKGRKQGQIHGRSPYLQSVHVMASESFIGQILPVYIVNTSQNSLTGKLCSDLKVSAA